MKQFDQGEFRKFWLTIFVTMCNLAIILVSILSALEKDEVPGLNYAAFTAAVGFQTLILQYYYRKKSPNGTNELKKGDRIAERKSDRSTSQG